MKRQDLWKTNSWFGLGKMYPTLVTTQGVKGLYFTHSSQSLSRCDSKWLKTLTLFNNFHRRTRCRGRFRDLIFAFRCQPGNDFGLIGVISGSCCITVWTNCEQVILDHRDHSSGLMDKGLKTQTKTGCANWQFRLFWYKNLGLSTALNSNPVACNWLGCR